MKKPAWLSVDVGGGQTGIVKGLNFTDKSVLTRVSNLMSV